MVHFFKRFYKAHFYFHFLPFFPSFYVIFLHTFYFLHQGIFAYLNYRVPRTRKNIFTTLVKGLQRLEYRGYDSAGESSPSNPCECNVSVFSCNRYGFRLNRGPVSCNLAAQVGSCAESTLKNVMHCSCLIQTCLASPNE